MKLRIKELRQSRKWTQDHLAELAGTTKSHISEIESGKKNPSNPMLQKLAQAFKLSVIDLIDPEDSGELHILMKAIEELSPANQVVVRRLVESLRDTEASR